MTKATYKTYIIYNKYTNLFKIGKGKTIYGRIAELSRMNGVKLDIKMIINNDVEKELHWTFAKKRKLGEWFSLVDEDISIVIKKYGDSLMVIDEEMYRVFLKEDIAWT